MAEADDDGNARQQGGDADHLDAAPHGDGRNPALRTGSLRAEAIFAIRAAEEIV